MRSCAGPFQADDSQRLRPRAARSPRRRSRAADHGGQRRRAVMALASPQQAPTPRQPGAPADPAARAAPGPATRAAPGGAIRAGPGEVLSAALTGSSKTDTTSGVVFTGFLQRPEQDKPLERLRHRTGPASRQPQWSPGRWRLLEMLSAGWPAGLVAQFRRYSAAGAQPGRQILGAAEI